MMRGDSRLSALALLVRKFGKRIEGGGYEIEVTALEMTGMSQHGTFQEVPSSDGLSVKWRYYPNTTIDVEPGSWKDVTPNSIVKADGRPIQSPETDEPPPA